MKRSLSICILILTMILLFLIFGIIKNNYEKKIEDDSSQILVNETTESTEVIITTNEDLEYCEYYLINDCGKISVIDNKGELFSLTNINYNQMSEDDKIKIQNGNYGFKNITEVYDFLESYSS